MPQNKFKLHVGATTKQPSDIGAKEGKGLALLCQSKSWFAPMLAQSQSKSWPSTSPSPSPSTQMWPKCWLCVQHAGLELLRSCVSGCPSHSTKSKDNPTIKVCSKQSTKGLMILQVFANQVPLQTDGGEPPMNSSARLNFQVLDCFSTCGQRRAK
eukprot:1072605-Amphidinium_carterae.1